MFAVGFPEVGNAAFHLSDEILYPVVRRLRSFTRFFPDKASQRKTDDLRAATTGAPRKRLDPFFQFRSQAYGQLARHVIIPFFPFIPCNAILTHLHCIVKCNTINIFLPSVWKWIPDSTETAACRPELCRELNFVAEEKHGLSYFQYITLKSPSRRNGSEALSVAPWKNRSFH